MGDGESEARSDRILVFLQARESGERRSVLPAVAVEQDAHGLCKLRLTVAEMLCGGFGQCQKLSRSGEFASFAVTECQSQLQTRHLGGRLLRFIPAPRREQ